MASIYVYYLLVQSKPGYSNYLFLAKDGKKEPTVRKNVKINTKM